MAIKIYAILYQYPLLYYVTYILINKLLQPVINTTRNTQKYVVLYTMDPHDFEIHTRTIYVFFFLKFFCFVVSQMIRIILLSYYNYTFTGQRVDDNIKKYNN